MCAAEVWDYSNSVLKVPLLSWTLGDLYLSPQICLEHRSGFSLADVLPEPWGLEYAVFDNNRNCCPVSFKSASCSEFYLLPLLS